MLYRIATTIVFHVVSFISFTSLYCQKIATFEMNMSANPYALGIAIHLPADAITPRHDSFILLRGVSGRERKIIPYQLQVSLTGFCKVPCDIIKNKQLA